ncbi:MAG: hypothetical protein AB7S26_32860 [Sandaracinaceae bacterium]
MRTETVKRPPLRGFRSGQRRALGIVVGFAVCVSLGAACEEEPAPPPRFPFTFSAHTDRQPMEGVSIRVNDQEIGVTDDHGQLRLDLTGPPGATVLVSARCPEGHRSPEQPQPHTLRVIQSLDPAASARGVQVSFECPPEYRDAVVVVRAHDRADLPVLVDGREVTRTDASGAAHVHMRMSPQTSFHVQIATASNERLRPRDPVMSYTVPDHDTIFTFDQRFEEEARRRTGRRRSGPTKVPTTSLPFNIGRPRH